MACEYTFRTQSCSCGIVGSPDLANDGTPYICPKKYRDFCIHCGACIPPKYGEGTCPKCDPELKHGKP